MKSTYVQPVVRVYQIQAKSILTASSISVKGTYSEGSMTDLARQSDDDFDEE